MAAAVIDNYNQQHHHNQHHHHHHQQPLCDNDSSNVSLLPAAGARRLIGDALHQRVAAIDHEVCEPGDEDTFYVADLGHVYRQHLRWKKNLPRVKPFYAVKCNPDPQVLRLLAGLGTGFDCASKTEIEQVLAMGISPDRVIYAQP
ncbi:hypothetical protein CDD83_1674 [Cordyceps sp. RAO-2017]|nr:hypothetical protein CDD83_1674 [Cordyceps sp. RAO-2017]